PRPFRMLAGPPLPGGRYRAGRASRPDEMEVGGDMICSRGTDGYFGQSREETGRVGVPADQPTVFGDDTVHCADLSVCNSFQQQDDILLVRHRDVAAPPVRVGAPGHEVRWEF